MVSISPNIVEFQQLGNSCSLSSKVRLQIAFHAFLGCCFVMLSACQQRIPRDAPQTYPVTGKLLSAKGEPLAGIAIEFQPKGNEVKWLASGTTNEHGEFSLSITLPDHKLLGATEGLHRVYVLEPMKADRSGGERHLLEGDFIVKSEDNHFELTLSSKSP